MSKFMNAIIYQFFFNQYQTNEKYFVNKLASLLVCSRILLIHTLVLQPDAKKTFMNAAVYQSSSKMRLSVPDDNYLMDHTGS